MEYRVQLDLFEGPLDLLLYLIKKNELDITDIPIADVTEQYLQYIKMMKDLNLDIASEYLVMAATLTQIKSRMILPSPEPGEAEEEDPRAELIRQLLEYQKYKEAADSLLSREILGRDTFVRSVPEETVVEPEGPGVEASLFDLLDAFRSVMKKATDPGAGEEVLALEEISHYRISLAQRMDEILLLLSKAVEKYPVEQGIPFEDLFEGEMTRAFIVVTFLSLLELIRQKLVRIFQMELFGRIWVRPRLAPINEPEPEPPAETPELPLFPLEKPAAENPVEPAIAPPAPAETPTEPQPPAEPQPTNEPQPPAEPQKPEEPQPSTESHSSIEPAPPPEPQAPIADSPAPEENSEVPGKVNEDPETGSGTQTS
ncbi:MAG: segregation/condensation protein A [bacterium]|nr:segregation/condensation protein A [bacterium]